VTAKGKIHKEEGKFAKGSPGLDFAEMTDEDLVKKFRMNVARTLPQKKVDKAVTSLMELEKVKNISEVVEQVTL
jgi:hypothetical protein